MGLKVGLFDEFENETPDPIEGLGIERFHRRNRKMRSIFRFRGVAERPPSRSVTISPVRLTYPRRLGTLRDTPIMYTCFFMKRLRGKTGWVGPCRMTARLGLRSGLLHSVGPEKRTM
jgi:hypothetical protein